jgi:hypothetical protein
VNIVMKLRLSRCLALTLAGAVCVVTLPGTFVQSVQAQQAIATTPGTACRAERNSESFVDFSVDNRVVTRVLGAVDTHDVQVAGVLCSVVRAHLNPTGAEVLFFVDGKNPPGRGTVCGLHVFTFTGQFRASVFFLEDTNRGRQFGSPLSIPRNLIADSDYVFVECALPPHGELYGITSMP